MTGNTLFWSLKPETQAALMQWQYDNYGEKMDIPTPPMTNIIMTVNWSFYDQR